MLNIDHFELYSVAIITILAVISPGPDFAMVSKMALLNGRKEGMLCALGIGAAISVHLAYTLFGLGILFAENVWVLNTLRYLGAMYLIWLGLSALWPDIKRALGKRNKSVINSNSNTRTINSQSPFWTGFTCNALNPKTMLFIVSLFSQVISTSTSWQMELAYGLYIALAHFVWFSLVACLLTAERVQQQTQTLKAWIERVSGVFLTGFGIRLFVD
ncbi:LysE family translocator [Marinomonas sp. C2222]|uniref:LysE family translocator n=1 Tax=Marinomonas sargassi TaxID=2984494 RepID=A0ABT2YQT4_9GAMM|nr:LysE family translocator [Marinomonas sargassi]MCV2402253.1 LysE family translocator [Marinomonas sargassi]